MILLCFLCGETYLVPLCSENTSAEANKKIWVFFKDKGVSHHDTGISDLPVFAPYIDGVLRLGAILRVASRWLNGITVEVPDDSIQQILKLPYVKSVEPVVTYRRERLKTKETSIPKQSHPHYAPSRSAGIMENYGMSATQIQQIRADILHNKGYHGEGITIAILDTGFDLSHESLRDVRVLAEYDFINNDRETSDNPPEDDIGQDEHGTEVLSIIAGNSPGNLVGVAYAADYLLAKTERVSYKGVLFEQQIEEDWWIAGLEWAEFNGADIVSSSLGYSGWYSYSDMDGKTARTTIAANMAVEKGVVVVVSVGNEGKSVDWPYMSAPADGFHVIAVGAVNYKGELADFSSIGPTYDGRIKPDLVAMGDENYVADPNNTAGYRKADGTSMATPLVAGTAALLMQAIPGLDDPKDIEKLLKYTATRSLSPDNRYGWGIINAEAALRYGTSPHSIENLKAWDPTGAMPNLQQVLIYPNPVRRSSISRVNIHTTEPIDSISIYSISGLLIYEREDVGSARFSVWELKNQYGQEVAGGIYVCVIRKSTGVIGIEKIAVID